MGNSRGNSAKGTQAEETKPLTLEEKWVKIYRLLEEEDSVEKLKAIVGSTPLTEISSDYNTLLRLAADFNRVKVCEFLLDSKMDINLARQVSNK